MGALQRNNVHVLGSGELALVFSHGFGCDQNVWQRVAPAFCGQHRVVLFDHVGSGNSDVSAYNRTRYGTLEGYAEDLLELCRELALPDVVLVGHSVGATIAALAARKEPERFAKLVLLNATPRYIDDADYKGGFSRAEIDDTIDTIERNYFGWARIFAPMVMGTPERPELGRELTEYFCRMHPEIARHFARVTFYGDYRAEFAEVLTRTLIVQGSNDRIAPEAVGEYLHRQVGDSEYTLLKATGHCPHLSAPDEVCSTLSAFLRDIPA